MMAQQTLCFGERPIGSGENGAMNAVLYAMDLEIVLRVEIYYGYGYLWLTDGVSVAQ